MKQVLEMDRERWRRGEVDRAKREKKRQRRKKRMAVADRQRAEAIQHAKWNVGSNGGGGGGGDGEMGEDVEDEELSSSTDEITDSD